MQMTKDVVVFAPSSNMEGVCLQGLGAGLQLQRADGSVIWNPTGSVICIVSLM
jgi:hypothetical protein